jgi:hypothetical protein
MTKTKYTPPIVSASEYKPSESITALIYGPTKSGKTFFAGSFNSPRTVYINIGAGIATLYSPLAIEQYGKPEFQLINIIEDFENPKMYMEVSETLNYFFEPDRLDTFDTIIIDDASAMNYAAMNQGMTVSDAVGRSKALGISRKLGVNIPGRQDFGMQMSLMDQFMRFFTEQSKAFNKNFIVLAHDKEVYKGEGEKRQISKLRPLFTGNNDIPAYFDLVWMMESVAGGRGNIYRAITEGDEIIEAGSRWGGIFPTKYKNPNYKEIKNALDTLTPIVQK